QAEATETARAELEDMEVEIQGNDVVRDMEEDEMEREGVAAPVRRQIQYCMIMERRTL
ncbi:hypothetical protein A2U01_0116210, partial [Trifolium medium]|nr:hypothetical protein [Trifolium medium]